MKRNVLVVLAATGAMLLTACASSTSTTVTATPKTATGTMFCYQERLYTAGNDLVCNWASSSAEACRDNTQSSRIAVSATASAPVEGVRCANGLRLVQVTMK